MVRLVTYGFVSAVFFSTTFVLNRVMSLEGGHWVWTASLRYAYMLFFLSICLLVTSGPKSLMAVARVFRAHWRFWLIAGSVGFGCFYAPFCFAASYAPSWMIACSWQSTILATPLVLMFFGRKVPGKGVFFTTLVFFGIVLVNAERLGTASLRDIVLSVSPVFLAAIAYPIGFQLVGEAKKGTHKNIPHIADPVMNSVLARVLLMTIGSIPFWLAVVVLFVPPAPTSGQIINTAIVAMSSGVIATSILTYAWHKARKPYEIAAVGTSQAGETMFALLGGVLFLHEALPGVLGTLGLLLIVLGIFLYMFKQKTPQ